ncbi:MAG: hypothetical protein IPF72_14835 [Chitinophagaceae bacterium]|nr:hypothetical protein [Chitinophagaceae bacterium]
MNKIWLIIKREYVTRVRNKTFLLSTFLLPLMIVLFIAGSIFLSVKSEEKSKRIAFADSSEFFKPLLRNDSSKLNFVFDKTIDTVNYTKKALMVLCTRMTVPIIILFCVPQRPHP